MANEFVNFDVKMERFRDAETGRFLSGKAFKNLYHAAASIAKFAKASIRRSATASAAGRPPSTRRGLLKRAIRYDVDRAKQRVVIGPRESVVGGSASAHEFGKTYKGDQFEPRPFMGPALQKNLHRLGGSYTGSIGG